MARKANPIVVGAFVLGAVALAIAAVIVFGSGRLFRKTHSFVLFFDGDVSGLRVGAPVKFKGVQIGRVSEIRLNLPLSNGRMVFPVTSEIKIPVVVELEDRMLRSGAPRVANLGDPRLLRSLIDQGLRGTLATESFVTGMLYVNLAFYPHTPAKFILPPNSHYQEIPTLPNTLQQAQQAATKVIASLEQVDFKKVMTSATETLSSIQAIVSSPQLRAAIEGLSRSEQTMNKTAQSLQQVANRMNNELGPLSTSLQESSRSANAALIQARATLGTLHTTFAPGSPLIYQTRKTLRDMSAAARSMRQLTQYLQRNPSAIVRGRDYSEDGQ